MTVAELIAKLRSMPQDQQVIIEGCDCANPAKDVEEVQSGIVSDACVWITADLDGGN